MEITNQDWKLFRSRLPDWQEAYMNRLNQEYAKILSGDGIASDKFWTLEKRIRQDKRSPGVQLQLRRSDLFYHLATLLNDGVITFKDLDGFSDNLLDALHFSKRGIPDKKAIMYAALQERCPCRAVCLTKSSFFFCGHPRPPIDASPTSKIQ